MTKETKINNNDYKTMINKLYYYWQHLWQETTDTLNDINPIQFLCLNSVSENGHQHNSSQSRG